MIPYISTAMLYILAVNASILTDSGGTCECTDAADPTCSNDPAYNTCLGELRRELVIATAAISAISSVLMGLRECESYGYRTGASGQKKKSF